MAGFAKGILISILVAAVILMFSNLAFFFPWYMSMVYETFNLSQAAASDNYLKSSLASETVERLKGKPVFNRNPGAVKVTAVKVDSATGNSAGDAIGADDETYYYGLDDDLKPYRQRGEKIRITLEAVYPFSISVAGNEIQIPFHVGFSLETAGLKYYKDLDKGIYRDIPV